MQDHVAIMKEHKPTKQFFIAIDSDGCAFDSMDKSSRKSASLRCTASNWGLQPIAKYARMAAEFVNLYSKWRGVNRFPAMLKTFDLLDEWGQGPRARFQVSGSAQPAQVGRDRVEAWQSGPGGVLQGAQRSRGARHAPDASLEQGHQRSRGRHRSGRPSPLSPTFANLSRRPSCRPMSSSVPRRRTRRSPANGKSRT